MKCEKCKGTGHICKISGIDFIGYTAEVSHCQQCKGSGEVTAQQSVQPTVLTHAPNCALVQSLVADCNCHLAKSHSG